MSFQRNTTELKAVSLPETKKAKKEYALYCKEIPAILNGKFRWTIAPNGNYYTLSLEGPTSGMLEIFDGKSYASIAKVKLPDAGIDFLGEKRLCDQIFVADNNYIVISFVTQDSSRTLILDPVTFAVKFDLPARLLLRNTAIRLKNKDQFLCSVLTWGGEIPSGLYRFELTSQRFNYHLISDGSDVSCAVLPDDTIILAKTNRSPPSNGTLVETDDQIEWGSTFLHIEKWILNENQQYACQKIIYFKIAHVFSIVIRALSTNKILLSQYTSTQGRLQIWDTDQMICCKDFGKGANFNLKQIHQELVFGYSMCPTGQIMLIDSSNYEFQSEMFLQVSHVDKIADDSLLLGNDDGTTVKARIIDKQVISQHILASIFCFPEVIANLVAGYVPSSLVADCVPPPLIEIPDEDEQLMKALLLGCKRMIQKETWSASADSRREIRDQKQQKKFVPKELGMIYSLICEAEKGSDVKGRWRPVYQQVVDIARCVVLRKPQGFFDKVDKKLLEFCKNVIEIADTQFRVEKTAVLRRWFR